MSTTRSDLASGPSVPQQPADAGGDEVPGITLTRELGHGGFGTVYLGRETVIGRDVAVKIDRRSLLDDSDRRRFTREVTAAGQVSAHPNIVTLLSGGITRSNRPYLVMELCPGGSMNDRIAETGAQPAADVVRVGIAIADALAAAHAVGILHRDVKPANILVTAYGAPALADFGLASLPAQYEMATMSQHALTPSFAAPESFLHNAVTPQADVYSLGATLYALLAGRPPRMTASGSPSIVEMLELSREPLPRLDIPGVPGLMDAIAHATHPDPARRTPSAAALRDELLAVASAALPGDDVRRYAPAVGTGVGLGGVAGPDAGSGAPVGGPSGTVALTSAGRHRREDSGNGALSGATVGHARGPGRGSSGTVAVPGGGWPEASGSAGHSGGVPSGAESGRSGPFGAVSGSLGGPSGPVGGASGPVGSRPYSGQSTRHSGPARSTGPAGGTSGAVYVPPPSGPRGPGVSGPGGSGASGPVRPSASTPVPPGRRRLGPGMIALIAAGGVVLLALSAWGAVMTFTGKGPLGGSGRGGAEGGSGQGDPAGADVGADSGAAEAPATEVDPADLPQIGSCWAGLTYISGAAPTSREVPCTEDHYWEAFATGTLDAGTDHTMADSLEADPVAAETCTVDALAGYLGEQPPEDVEIAVLGPREGLADQGDRTFVCLADAGRMTTAGG